VLCLTFHSHHITDLPLPDVLTHLQRASAVGAAADDDEFRGRGWELMPSGRLAHDRWYVRVCMCVCVSVLLCEEVVCLPLSAQCVVPLYWYICLSFFLSPSRPRSLLASLALALCLVLQARGTGGAGSRLRDRCCGWWPHSLAGNRACVGRKSWDLLFVPHFTACKSECHTFTVHYCTICDSSDVLCLNIHRLHRR